MAKLVMLDRDGVLNVDRPDGVRRMSELEMVPGALEAIAALCAVGFGIAVVTNQSAIGRGHVSSQVIAEIHARIARQAEALGGRIDRFYVCPDAPERPTSRRKPAPGMLLEALADFNAEAATTPFIGDDVRDLAAAAAAGCPPYLVLTGKGARVREENRHLPFDPVVTENLGSAASHIIGRFA